MSAMANNSNDVNTRLQDAALGTPKLNPDEQRKYLGTFRERVAVTMSVSQLKSNQYQDTFIQELKKHPDYQLFINGNVGQELIGPYMKAASQISLKFTIKTDDIYTTADQSLALVLASKESINVQDIDISHFQSSKTPTSNQEKPKSLLDKLKNSFLK
ncbi:hypothetical protein IV84_GL000294 [Pediococcus damnosus]|nr:hypothetical protein IV84_GL000294 [Pediococcus damnosus]